MSSIRLFLTISIISIVILANFLAAVKGYQSSMRKADEIFDAKMLHIAKLILSSTAFTIEKPVIKAPNDDTLLRRELKDLDTNNINFSSEMLYAVKDKNKRIITKSARLKHTSDIAISKSNSHFGWVNFDKSRWRQLDYFDLESSLTITLYEKQTNRFLLAETVILESIYPILLAIPSIALVVFFIVGRGLKPLLELSNQMKHKKANNLSPIALSSLPKELLQLNNSLNHLLSRLDGAINREKRFSADAAHELRTPITALSLQMINLLHEVTPTNTTSSDGFELSPSKIKESIADLTIGVKRMSHLVEQILTLNQISVDDYCDNFKRVNLTSILRQTIAEIYPLIENKNQQIELQFITDNSNTAENNDNKIRNINSDYFINGDEHGLICLFTNLIENANKYTPENGSIRVVVRELANNIVISVIDSGKGISEQEKLRIFDRFYRAGGDSHNSKETGCGLGLSIVQEISSRHNATISVFSPNNQDISQLKESYKVNFDVGLWLDLNFEVI